MVIVSLSAIYLPSAATNFKLGGCLENSTETRLFPSPRLSTGLYRQTIKSNRSKKALYFSLVAKCDSTIKKVDKENGIAPTKGAARLILSEGRDSDENYGPICPGCGIFMQDNDPNLPGFYKEKMAVVRDHLDKEEDLMLDEFGEFEEEREVEDEEGSDSVEVEFKNESGEDWDLEKWESDWEKDDDELKELDGFGPAGVGYGNITEETINKGKKEKLSKSQRKRLAREAQREKEEVTVCARCHSLRNYGHVKNEIAENLIPDFDFDRLITTRLMKPTGVADATVVVMVVDCVDFDGSFPKRAAKSLFKAFEGSKEHSKLTKKLPKLVLVATKVDLLPSQISPARLDRWVRHRAKANGAPKLSGVYLISAHKDLGVRNLLALIKELAGPRGNVWVIGAQNAGKSTLINAFAKKEGTKVTKLTEAAVPGTTLGILRIGGILSAKAKMYDTPGLLHPYLISMRLNRVEQKMVEIRKQLKPRTYRIKAGQTVHVGGLVRIDLNWASVETIYVTTWASPNISLHLGKIENADEIKSKHVGMRLQPPVGAGRVSELGKWEKKEAEVSGISWDVNCIDVAVAGLGWASLGLKGKAKLTLWTYDGIEITLREPLVLDRAMYLERPGFWLPKAVSDAVAEHSKLEVQERRKHEEGVGDLMVQ